jgi:hypothetical protein
MTKVHVTLTEHARSDGAVKLRIKRLIADLGMQHINERRFARFGVLSGDIDLALLPKLRTLDAVEAVECDQERTGC